MSEDDKKPAPFTAARVTRPDINRMAVEAAKNAKADRELNNAKLRVDGDPREERARLYVVCTMQERGGWLAEVVSGMSRLEQTMLGKRRLGAKGLTADEATRRIHTAYYEFLRREKIMGDRDARLRAARAHVDVMDRIERPK